VRSAALAAWLACAAATQAVAQPSGPGPRVRPGTSASDWYLQVDNDVLFGTDRWYTSGVRLARVSGDVEWGIVQRIFTPEAKRYPSDRPDRSPTARLLATLDEHFRGEFAFQTVGLALGVRGPSALGEQATGEIHRYISAPFVDWSRQLPDEYDAFVAWTRTQRSARESPFGEGLKLHFGTVLGNQELFAHLGAEYRIGDASARGLSSRLLRFASTPPLTDAGERARGWSAFAGASLRGVGRNELLSRDYDPAKPELAVRRAVGRLAAGATYGASWGSVELAVAGDTAEFSGQRTPHAFGSLTVHVAF
jgi:hypothetical protein